MSNDDQPLFSQHEHALERAYGTCPDCDDELTIKHGKSGSFIGCQSYPRCQYTRPVVEHEHVDDKVLPGTQCPKCESELAVKQGRYGMFIGCTNYPACNHIEHEEAAPSGNIVCPQCGKGHLQEKQSRFGKTFYACDNYPKCKFAVNHQPIEGACEKCQYPLLLKRNMARGEKQQCALKKCGHFQSES